jgi:hypothetical protein
VLVEADVAVGVDQPRNDPSLGDRVGTGLCLVGDGAVDDVEVPGLAIGEDRTAESLSSHGGDAIGQEAGTRLVTSSASSAPSRFP